MTAWKLFFWGLISGLILCPLSGCVSGAKRDGIAFERLWVRDTLEEPSMSSFNNMVFHPVVVNDIVIAGNNVDGLVAYSKFLGSKKWTYRLKGGLSNPPTSVGNYIFFSTYTGEALAINAKNGKLFWKVDIDYPTTKQFTFENGRIYIHTQNDDVLCLEASTGERVWTYKHTGQPQSQISETNPPLILGAMVVSGFSDGSVVALEKYNGQERWQKRLNFNKRFRDIHSINLFDKDKILVGSYEDKVYALEGMNGAVLWEKDYQTITNFVETKDKTFCAGTLSQEILCFDPLKEGKKTQTYSIDSSAEHLSLSEDLLFFGLADGGLGALNIQTSQLYKYTSFSGVSTLPFILSQDKKVYFSTNQGNVYSLKYHF